MTASQRKAGRVFWLMGLPGAGKTTLARLVESELLRRGAPCAAFDGDVVRRGLCNDLGYTAADRRENLRRVAETVKLCRDAGVVCLASFITPLREHRDMIRMILGQDNFVEIFVKCPLEICEQRDPKGLYRLARAGAIADFTGVSSLFEEPMQPHLTLDTASLSIAACVEAALEMILPAISM